MAPSEANWTGLRIATAARYWRAAHKLVTEGEFVDYWEPSQYLLAMAAELALKAALAERGKSEAEIRRLSHHLDQAVRKAIEAGIPISAQQAGSLLVAARPHSTHYFRYGPQQRDLINGGSVEPLPDIDGLLWSVMEIIDTVGGPFVLRSQRGNLEGLPLPAAKLNTASITLKQLDALQAEMERSRIALRSSVTASTAASGKP